MTALVLTVAVSLIIVGMYRIGMSHGAPDIPWSGIFMTGCGLVLILSQRLFQ